MSFDATISNLTIPQACESLRRAHETGNRSREVKLRAALALARGKIAAGIAEAKRFLASPAARGRQGQFAAARLRGLSENMAAIRSVLG